VIIRAHEMTKEIKQARGGKGSIEVIRVVQPEQTYTKHVQTFGKVTINPGNSVGLHAHDTNEEIYYVLKGKALFNDNGTEKELLPGDAALTGGGGTHSIEALGSEPLEFIGVIVG
jgi:mannose-6-phosphate isomerase-like protein (cupin superfamily)